MILRDKIYNTIKERITSGEYAPGQPLNEKDIITELNTSRTPFREAINALSEEGLVQVYPHRGIFVRDLSLKDITDGFDIRYLLEPYVLELASQRMPLSKIDDLIERINNIDQTDYFAMLEEDSYFHKTLVDYIDNKQLCKIMSNLYAYNQFQVALFDNPRTKYVSPERLNGTVQSLKEHLDVLLCMKRRDTAAALEKMRYHLAQARKRTLQ